MAQTPIHKIFETKPTEEATGPDIFRWKRFISYGSKNDDSRNIMMEMSPCQEHDDDEYQRRRLPPRAC